MVYNTNADVKKSVAYINKNNKRDKIDEKRAVNFYSSFLFIIN